jgi:hypothetical protein
LKRASRLPIAILVILLLGTAGVVLFRLIAPVAARGVARVAADAKPHSVLLKWNPPTPMPGLTVTGYNIYRSRPDGSIGPLASVPGPTYVDTQVSSGTTYYYFVKAVDAAGHEGLPSNPATAVIP